MMKHYVRLACFVGGALFGSVGVKLLASKDAKNAYTHITAAGLRMKDSVMETVTSVQENAADILAAAKVGSEMCIRDRPRTSMRPGPPKMLRLRWMARRPEKLRKGAGKRLPFSLRRDLL